MTTNVHVTPTVRQLAARLGIDLAQVRGTGIGGRITPTDVQAAANARRPATPPDDGRDPNVYGRNPLLAQARAERGGARRVQYASQAAPAPTLFTTGDLPPATASGIDPQQLLQVPWYARHAIAAEASQARAAALLQDYAGPDGDINAQLDGVAGHPGNADYQMRVLEWLDRGDKAAATAADDQVWRQHQQARQARAQAQQRAEEDIRPEEFDRLFSRPPADAGGPR